MASGFSAYGPTGSKSQDLQRRFQESSDPRPAIFISPNGGLVSTIPGYALGTDGAPNIYRSSTAIIESGGLVNLFRAGDRYTSLPGPRTTTTVGNFTLADGSDQTLLPGYKTIAREETGQFPGAIPSLIGPVGTNGEWFDTTSLAAVPGCYKEPFTVGAQTVSVTNHNTGITLSAGTWAGFTLTFGAYNPSLNGLRQGDIIAIDNGGTLFPYRIISYTATVMEIFPTYQGTTNGARTFQLYRTGFGSYSRNFEINIAGAFPSGDWWIYVGNVINQNVTSGVPSVNGPGAVEAIREFPEMHAMCPKTTSSLGTDIADVRANDLIPYKGFLLYGYGPTISWSIANAPTGTTTTSSPFGHTDFPAGNITVPLVNDYFVAFETIGDQLYALFTDSIWLIQATGVVPEFNFYRVPTTMRGSVFTHVVGSQGVTGATAVMRRTTVGTPIGIFFVSTNGINLFDGTRATSVSEKMDDIFTNYPASLYYVPSIDYIVYGQYGMSLRTMEWTQMGMLPGTEIPFLGDYAPVDLTSNTGMAHRWAYYDQPTGNIIYNPVTAFAGTPVAANSSAAWKWMSPIINLSDVYGSFTFGGLRIDCEGVPGTNQNLTWKIYGGYSPSALFLRATGTAPINVGTSSARDLLGLGGKIDDPWIAIVIQSTTAPPSAETVRFGGVALYVTSSKSAN